MERFSRDLRLAPIDQDQTSRRGNNGFFSLGPVAYFLGLALVSSVCVASNSLAREARDQEIAAWVSRSSRALDDPASLEPGQRYYERVRVVGAGRDLGEQLDMNRRRGLVNVRRGPDLKWEIIGRVRVGGDVHNVVIYNNWGAVRCRDITDLEPVDRSKPTLQPTLQPTHEMCAIHADYLMK